MVELIGKMFNRGSNSFARNKQLTVSYHGRTSLTSKHLFFAATRVSCTIVFFIPFKPPDQFNSVHAYPNHNPAAVTSFSNVLS